ncbi:MAG: adenylate/guanylate cyclase domain-containing protein [Burkholderiales bacterium]
MESNRKLAAILSADVYGYSRMMGEDDHDTVETLNASREVMQRYVADYGGRVVDAPGDEMLAEFPSALEAVKAAVEIQRNFTERNAMRPENRKMRWRIGINLGDVIDRSGALYGDGVNIAARLQSLGEPGGVCISGTVFDQIDGKLPLKFEPAGEQLVKNIAKPVRVFHWSHGKAQAVAPAKLKPLLHSYRSRGVALAVVALAIIGAAVWQWQSNPTTLSMPSPAGAGLANNRLAVLPFVNMSANSEEEYFADGMTEELISRLSRVKGLEVIARTSIATYKGTKKNIGAIAKELNVGTVLEGSVRTASGKVRVTAQLINATSDAHLWSEDYDREMKDIFTVQSDIAQHVANALTARLAPAPAAVPAGDTHVLQPTSTGTKNLAAYHAYLKGRFFYNKGTVEGIHKAIKHFDDAIRYDPSYALVYAALAETYEQLTGYEGGAADRLPKARSLALRALHLDDSVADAHTALGVAKAFYDYDLPGAGESFRHALVLNANSAAAHNWYGWYLMYMRRYEEGLTELRRAVELDPVSLIMQSDLGWGFWLTGRWDEAIEQGRRTLGLAPDSAWGLDLLGWAYIGKGMYQQAGTNFAKETADPGRLVNALAGLASMHAYAGETGDALRRLAELNEQLKAVPSQPWLLAAVYCALASRDELYRDKMFQWLDKVYEERSFLLVFTSSWFWRPFHTDPRWIAFRKKLGLPP